MLYRRYFLNLFTKLSALALTSAPLAESEFLVGEQFQDTAIEYGIQINKPGAPLNYSYSNSPIALKDLSIERQWSEMNSDAQDFEKSVVRINNETDPDLTRTIADKILQDAQFDLQYFKALLGYHEIIPASYSNFRVNQSGDYDYVSVNGRYGQTLKAVCLRKMPSENRAFLLLLPGRATTAKATMGLSEKADYSNAIGQHFSNKLDISVCALGNFPHTDVPILRLGLSGRGVAIASVIDFLTAIKTEAPQEAQNIILGGISNGGHMAEYTAVISDLVDAVLSSGAAARYDFSNSPYSFYRNSVSNYPNFDYNYATFDAVFRSGRIFNLIHPKPLIVSIGTHDAGHEVNGYPSKLEQIKLALETYKDSRCLEVNLFVGGHAHDHYGETRALSRLLAECFSQPRL
tara:strand:- start:730 stop:1941 length:1212 start_codon:yes stop_codon:yes gene_type:complete